ncbi:MAG TPA: hypothetical protein PKE27_15830 [Povalibacter sp.]|uniref:hypothetical protein n=1 Tax=Povalibacter sp. TaxID=1962978 RepID=UPI002C2FE1EF|nr:hypothetical protein [Povalibacter sp.]HMN46048.1 hypothetical protein [Povalibacter sp.]
MSTPSDDKAFDDYLERRSQVSQAYRALSSDDVPAQLDQQILAQARAALAGSAGDELAQVRAKRRRLMRWGVPAAIAASALLVVSIVIRSGVEHEVRSTDFSPAAKPAPAAVPAMPQQMPEKKQEAVGATAADSVVMIAPPRDAVTEFSSYARTPSREDKMPEQPVIETPAIAPAAPPPPQVAAMQERTQAAAASREREVQQAVAARRQEAARAAAIAPAAAMSRSVAESANVADSALNVARLHADPDDWLEHIRQLRRDGQQAAADREWQEFQETYPDHPVAETDLARAKTAPAP